MLTQERLKELVLYDPKSGVFTWIVDINSKTRKGMVVGSIDGLGYTETCIDHNRVRTHRLAFLYMLGYVPQNEVDHIDRDKGNNSWRNLREVSRQCNMRNTGNQANNTSGIKGVYFSTRVNKWVAQIKIDGKMSSVGRSEDFHEAVCYRLAVEQCLNWSGCDDSSPAYKFVQENIKNV